MKIGFNSLEKRMTVLLLCITLVPTLITGWIAHDLMFNHIKSDRMLDVGIVADAKRSQLVRALTVQNARANSFLLNLTRQCGGKAAKLDTGCTTSLLNSELATEGALEISLRSKNGVALSSGTPNVRKPEDTVFQAGQLAKFTGVGDGLNRSYFISVTDEKSGYRLVVTYPSSKLDSIFSPYPEALGPSGEAFLADGAGYFVTTHKYASAQGHQHPISSRPMQACLIGQSGEALDLDYRNAEIIHGFRFIPEFGSACIMAHIPQDEAFASLKMLERRLLIVLLVFSAILVMTAIYLSKKIVRPVTKLTSVARSIATADTHAKADESGNDEIAELGNAFNTMTRKLHESRQLLEGIVEHIPVMVFVKRASDLRFELFNRAGERLLGYSRSDLLGKGNYDLWPKEQGDSFTAADRKVLSSHEITEIPEEPIQIAGGGTRYLQTWKVALRDEVDEPTHLLGISVDITERKHAENALIASETQLKEELERRKRTEQSIRRVAAAVTYEKGEAFLQHLLAELAKLFDADYAFVGVQDSLQPQVINTLSVYAHGDFVDNMRYSLVGTPCANVVGRNTCVYAENVSKLFPEDKLLVDMGVESYIGSPLFDSTGKSLGLIVVLDGKPMRDVSMTVEILEIFATRAAAEIQRLHDEQQLRIAATAFETHEAIMITDANGNILRVNRAFQEMTGYSAEEVMGKNPRILSSGRQSKEFYADMWKQLKESGTWSGEIWDKRKSGQIYPKWQTITSVRDDTGKVSEYVAVSSDITSRKQAEEEIRHLAYYDALTGLPNRRLLMDRLRSALSVSARSHHYGAVLFLDMDKFKTLNDTLGHEFGDLLLIEVSSRIQSCLREMDSVARLGGDEFVILLEEVDVSDANASQKIALIAEKIRVALTLSYELKGSVQHSSPSIGVCLYRGHDESVDVILKHADMAMYQAKDSGRNAVRFFDPAMQLAVETRAEMETDLRRAVPGQQLHLYYQIQMDSDLRPFGAEALVRWNHPVRGMVSPAQFIPIAEDSSLILDIGGWVLDSACRQLAEWAEKDSTHNLILAVNVSAKQFRQHDFVDSVAAVMRTHEVDPSRLKLELTESVVLNEVADVVKKMHELKALGVRLSMDDFGTGYSSLSYLKQLPLDQVKIDQSFVRDIATDPGDAVMVQTIISLARNFRLNVIAEGVETQAQLDFLKQNGCMAYQGYFFSKPLPLADFERLLQQGRNA